MQLIDLFSGIGGFSLAGEWIGWRIIQFCEIDKFCQKILSYHWPDIPIHDDIKTFGVKQILENPLYDKNEVSIITGGFPCQPYSAAGKRKGKGDDRHLWPEMLRAIREIKPDWVVAENVLGIINWSEGLVFNEVQTDLEAEGYEVFPVVLPACGVNAPHRRYRVWFIAYRDSIRYSGRKFNENGQQYERRRKAWSEFTPLELCRTSPDTENKNDRLSVKTKKEYTKSGINGDKEITPNTKSERLEGENRFRMERTKQSSESNATDTKSNGINREEKFKNNNRQSGEQGGCDINNTCKVRQGNGNETIADTDSNKRSQRGMHTPESEETERHTGTRNARTIQCQTWDNFPTQSPLRGRDDEFSSKLDGITFSKWRNESIKAYGNAIVPKVAFQIFKTIEDYMKKEKTTKSRPDGKSYNCVSCGLYKDCITKRMQPYGEFKKGILNIGESPGEVEDKSGMPFQGRTGKLLQRTYRRLGIDLFEDCLNINAVNCRPLDNETPSNFQIECCRKRVLQVIEEYKPKVIILLGNSAVYSLIGHRWKKDLGGITKWRGFTIPDQDFQCWICPTFHPSYVERSTDGAEETVWRNDLKQAFELLEIVNHPFLVYKKPEISIITDLTRLDQIKEVFAIDFETTGRKSHAKGQRIVSCAIATDEDHALAFMLPKTRDEIQPLVRLLENPHVAKYGQNIKFETAWAEVRLKSKIQNWVWDTMLASHIYDNRQGITSLKFQTYVQFGVVDYSSDVEPYLKAADNKNANALNRIIELISTEEGKGKLLTYNGYDAINTYRLAILQRNQLLPF